jgi:hypothetical protein
MKESAIINGHMTISKSNKYDMELKKKIVSAPEGQIKKFRKVLIDPITGKEVVIQGEARIGGMKDGEEIDGRKHSLTCYITFRVEDVELILAPITEKKEKKEEDFKLIAEAFDLD